MKGVSEDTHVGKIKHKKKKKEGRGPQPASNRGAKGKSSNGIGPQRHSGSEDLEGWYSSMWMQPPELG